MSSHHPSHPLYDAEAVILGLRDEVARLNKAHQDLLVKHSVERQEFLDKIAELKEALGRETTIDHLTQALNRKGIDLELHRSFSAFKRDEIPFSVLYIDLDNFKPINDRLGHLVGDAVLKKVANVLRSQIRPFDRLGRWGGDEFAIILNHTNADAAKATLLKLQNVLSAYSIHLESEGYAEDYFARASAGFATANLKMKDENDLIEEADKVMRSDKERRKPNRR